MYTFGISLVSLLIGRYVGRREYRWKQDIRHKWRMYFHRCNGVKHVDESIAIHNKTGEVVMCDVDLGRLIKRVRQSEHSGSVTIARSGPIHPFLF